MLIRVLFCLFSMHAAIYGSAIPNFEKMSECESVTFFLSTPRSGSNLVSGCLGAITRKPISWLQWKREILDPSCSFRNHPSCNRLGLPMVSDEPLLYRTHESFSLREVPSEANKLIFITRNPKELLFREFYLNAPSSEIPSQEFINQFLDSYLINFYVFHSWSDENKYLGFYEDFIDYETEQFLNLLDFMQEEPTYLEDFLAHKEEYISKLLESYQTQHAGVKGGASSKNGPKEIYYSRDVPKKTLKYIDNYIKKSAPAIWKRYLIRFQTDKPIYLY